jgi:pimeloyl-ACP methyl ester carboxylesterase
MSQRVDTTDVSLHCEVDGEGPVVICAHGFPDGPDTFDAQLPALVGAGYRVARVTMRGYLPSGTARSGRYDPETLGSDLLAVADALSPDLPVCLIGHDWGAVAAYAASALAPDRVRGMVTMAVPHLRVAGPRWGRPTQLRRSWYMAFFQLPRLPERRIAEHDMAFIDELWRAWSPGYLCPPARMRKVKRGIAGREREVLAYYRALRLPSRARLLSRKTRVPTLYVHGEDDGCVAMRTAWGTERGYAGSIRMLRVPAAGHFVHLEQPEIVNRAILSHLEQA